jgi:hypothetical protein
MKSRKVIHLNYELCMLAFALWMSTVHAAHIHTNWEHEKPSTISALRSFWKSSAFSSEPIFESLFHLKLMFYCPLV